MADEGAIRSIMDAIAAAPEQQPQAAAPPAKPSFGIGDTWPARIAKAIYGAATLPGDVYQGNVSMTGDDGRTNPAVIDRAAELGGLMATGGLGGIPENALGSGLARMRMVGNADLFKELANQRRSAGMATGKSAPGWDFKRPDAPRGSWDDLLARTQAQWATDKSRAIGGYQDAAPSAARAGDSPLMSPADWAFIARNGGLGILLPGAAGAVLSRQNDGT